MTASILILIVSYSALLTLIAKRELPESLRLPIWLTVALIAGGMTLAALAITPYLGTGWIAYPFIVLSGPISLLAVSLVLRPLRSRESADSLTA